MRTYVVTLHWVRAYVGRTVYVVRASEPVAAIMKAVEKDNCYGWSYPKIEVEQVDGEVN